MSVGQTNDITKKDSRSKRDVLSEVIGGAFEFLNMLFRHGKEGQNTTEVPPVT